MPEKDTPDDNLFDRTLDESFNKMMQQREQQLAEWCARKWYGGHPTDARWAEMVGISRARLQVMPSVRVVKLETEMDYETHCARERVSMGLCGND